LRLCKKNQAHRACLPKNALGGHSGEWQGNTNPLILKESEDAQIINR
jgi:hypothetical protein